MDAKDVVFVLGPWAHARGPLYQRLARAVRDAIRRGDIGAPARLPSERDLARALGVSRTTVVSAYRVLRDEGLVESARGSGTRVSPSKVAGASMPPVVTPTLRLLGDPTDGVVDCSSAAVASVEGLRDDLLRVESPDVRRLAEGSPYEPLGLPGLRTAIAARYSALGLPTGPDEILVTTGAQQAVELLFTFFGRDRGAIVVENPTYAGALDAARAAGARVIGVDTGDAGVRLAELRDKLERFPVRLVYLMTRCHNPTGGVMDDAGRRAVARLAARAGAPVVDDMTMSDLVFDARPRSLLASSGGDNVVTVGSFSKLFWPGLRVGWVRASRPLIGRLARMKVVADLGSSQLSQLVAERLVGETDSFAAVRRSQLLQRLELVAALLRRELPEWSFVPPRGGPFLWARLPHGDADAFAAVALSHGVRVLSGRRMSPDDSTAGHVRISFVAEPDALRVAVARLRAAWDAFDGSGAAERVPVQVVV